MSELPLPEQLKGPWDHALILTYGMDLAFFEQTIMRQLPARCRNRIILGDGAHFLEMCADNQQSGLARSVNHRYVAEGIFAPRAAHAKLLLLVNPEQGRLLVGSGNLNLGGYASGGELFTQYDYGSDTPKHLAAFIAVRELLQGFMVRRYLSEAAERYLQLILNQTPWLYQAPATSERPVRHNLSQSFLQQLGQEVGDEPVEELVVLSPFYDEHCQALQRLLDLLRPAQLTILVQRERTSVDPEALQRVLSEFGGQARVRPVRRVNGDPYLHAKLYLVKQRDRAICLQGSPNLSQVALLFTDPQGNIELANLLRGDRDSFDDLVDGLEVEPPVKKVTNLNVSYQSHQTAPDTGARSWQLTAAAWNGTRLRIEYRGARPELANMALLLGRHEWLPQRWTIEERAIECTLFSDPSAIFDRPVALQIRLADGSETNPVFVCNTAALDVLHSMVIDDDNALSRIGGLDLDDQELETLLGLLDDALIIDQRSVWQRAGRKLPPTDTPDDDRLNLSYADIDYTMLRQHPRVQQYLRGLHGARAGRTRLQVILSAISDHFLDILDRATQTTPPTSAASFVPTTDLSEEELEEEEDQPAQRSSGQHQRTQRILKHFIRRYLRGVTSADFRAFAGVEILAQNYIIFSHILWRIWLKEWVDYDFMIDAFLTTWRAFWGDDTTPGCLAEANDETRERIQQLLREHYSISTLLAALYDSAYLARAQGWSEVRLTLRDFWRAFLTQHTTLITQEILEETWYHLADVYPYNTPRPLEIAGELEEVARFESIVAFLRSLERRHGYPVGSCHFERVEVYRETMGRKIPVECLVIDTPKSLSSADEAERILADWMSFKTLDYYRIVTPASNNAQRVALYEAPLRSGVFWHKLTNQSTELRSITLIERPWLAMIENLRHLASRLKVTIHQEQPQNVVQVR